jgi:hypothetical protein
MILAINWWPIFILKESVVPGEDRETLTKILT